MILLKLLITHSLSQDLSVEYSSDGLTLIRGNPDLKTFEIPKRVTTLSDGTESYNCFGDCTQTTSITFEEDSNLNYIGTFSFYQSKITSIDLTPCKNLKTISSSAFRKSLLESIIFSDSITTIDSSCFREANLKQLIFPPLLNGIHYHSFAFNTNLAKITFLPDCKTTFISAESFQDCGLTEVEIPASVVSIGSAFFGCPLTSVTINSSNLHFTVDQGVVLTADLKTICFAISSITSYECPPNLETITSHSFRETSLSSITFNEGLTTIYNCAFWNTRIESVIFPSSFTTLSPYAFALAKSLTSVTFNSAPTFGEYCFSTCISLKSIEIPYGTTKLDSYCFSGCYSLETIVISSTVTEIGGGTFNGVNKNCNISFAEGSPMIMDGDILYSQYYKRLTMIFGFSGSTVINLHWNTTTISATSLQSSSITKVVFPDNSSLTTIEERAFENSKLTEFYSPPSLSSIQDYAFHNCKSLKNLTLSNALSSLSLQSFSGCSLLESVTIPNSVETIENYAFDGCSGLKTLLFEATSVLTTIGENAFRGIGASVVSIPPSVTTANYAFTDSSIEALIIEESGETRSIWPYSFSGCKFLSEIKIGNDIESIEEGAFSNCIKMTAFLLSNSIKIVRRYSFKGCIELSTFQIQFGSSLESITGIAFEGCIKLEKLAVSSQNEKFMFVDGGLYNKTLTSLVMFLLNNAETTFIAPKSLKSVGNYALQGCTNLQTIIFQEGLEYIGILSLDGCTNLKKLELPNTLKSVEQSAFRDCTSLECGSVKFNEEIRDLILDAEIPLKALIPCPTAVFTSIHASHISPGLLLINVICCELLNYSSYLY